MALRLRSKAFNAFQEIPKIYSGEGNDRSPPLQWSSVPEGTREFVLMCEDPDAPLARPFLHWLVFHISANTTQLPEGLPTQERIEYPVLIRQGRNTFQKTGYTGPMPPVWHGAHHYYFKLYALDAELNVPIDADRDQIMTAMQGHILGQAQLVGFYERRMHKAIRERLDRAQALLQNRWKPLATAAGLAAAAVVLSRIVGRSASGDVSISNVAA